VSLTLNARLASGPVWPVVGGEVRRSPADGDVVDLRVRGRLGDVAECAYRAILAALAERPAAVVCDLSRVWGAPDADALAVLASAGTEVRDWPGVPIGLVCADRALRYQLAQLPDSRHLIIAHRRSGVLAQLRGISRPDTVQELLAPSARSARAARQLVARTLLDWGCGSQIGVATVVVNELVTSAMLRADGDLEVSVARCEHRIRVAVRDDGGDRSPPETAGRPRPAGRGLLLAAALAQSWGVQATAGGGRVVWVVLAAEPAVGLRGRAAAWLPGPSGPMGLVEEPAEELAGAGPRHLPRLTAL